MIDKEVENFLDNEPKIPDPTDASVGFIFPMVVLTIASVLTTSFLLSSTFVVDENTERKPTQRYVYCVSVFHFYLSFGFTIG